MTQIKVELKADVSKVVSLVDNEVIELDDGKALLNQFTKEDLITYVLSDGEPLEDNDIEGEFIDVEEEKTSKVKEPSKETIDLDDDKPSVDNTDDDEFNDLLS